MNKFAEYLNSVETLKKQKQYDQAWKVCNEGIIELGHLHDENWYMLYYQMADILAREKKWFDALVKMGLCLHFLGRLGGSTHEKFVRRLLKKFDKGNALEDFMEIVVKSEPREFDLKLRKLLG